MKDEYKAVGSWGTLGLEIVLSIAVGFFGGRWLDGRFGTEPWISVVGFFFGCAAATKAIHRTWQEMQAVTRREERHQGNPAPVYERPEDGAGEEQPGPRAGKRRRGSNGAEGSPKSPPEEHDERS